MISPPLTKIHQSPLTSLYRNEGEFHERCDLITDPLCVESTVFQWLRHKGLWGHHAMGIIFASLTPCEGNSPLSNWTSSWPNSQVTWWFETPCHCNGYAFSENRSHLYRQWRHRNLAWWQILVFSAQSSICPNRGLTGKTIHILLCRRYIVYDGILAKTFLDRKSIRFLRTQLLQEN